MALAWIAAAVAVSLVGTVLANLSNRYQRPLWGTHYAQVLLGDTPEPLLLFGPQIPLTEWNLFSSFLLVPFTVSLWLWRRDGGAQLGRVAALTAMVFGIVTGITRAVWLSAAALVALWMWRKRPRLTQLATLASMVAAALLVQALCLGATPLFQRGLERHTVTNRIAINRLSIDAWQARPLFGNGAGSVNRLPFSSREGGSMKVWTGNIVLFVLHDSGGLGLATLLALAAAVCHRAWPALRREARAPAPSLVVPLVAAGATLAFAYQFTHALWLMYPYVYLGFLTAATEPSDDG
jgi:O-antigen ligase